MATAMQEALLKGLGQESSLLNVRTLRESEASMHIAEEVEAGRRRKVLADREKRFAILRGNSKPEEFRREARKLMLEEPDLWEQILGIAHDRGLGSNRKGGSAIVGNLYALRDELAKPGLKHEDRRAIVGRKFSNK